MFEKGHIVIKNQGTKDVIIKAKLTVKAEVGDDGLTELGRVEPNQSHLVFLHSIQEIRLTVDAEQV